MQLKSVQTGESVPAHLIGQTEDGRPLYQGVPGYEPTEAADVDADGNFSPSATMPELRSGTKVRLTRDAGGLRKGDEGSVAERTVQTPVNSVRVTDPHYLGGVLRDVPVDALEVIERWSRR